MLVAALIVLGVAILCFIISAAAGSDGLGNGGIILLLIGIVLFLFTPRFQIGDQTLTGYVYQRKDSFGYVNYDLRFSQNAGQDNQPSFCVKSGSDTDKKLQEVVGTDAKIRLLIPSSGLHFVNNPFACASEAQLVSVGAANDKQ